MMVDQARLITELNKGWVYAKDTTVFFRGYDTFSEMLRSTGSFDPILLLEHYEQAVAHKTEPNDQILRYQLLRRARFHGDDRSIEKFYKFADDLVSRHCVTNYDTKSVTFLAYQGTISRTDDVYALMRKEIRRTDQEGRIRRKLLRVFDRFNNQNRERFFQSLLAEDGQGTHLFDAICGIHHQVVDNIDHWMDYPENPNKTEGNQNLLGDTLVFRVSRVTYATHNDTSFANQDKDLQEYLQSHSEATGASEGRFWKLDYYDNGRGIVENLKQFGKFAEDGFTLKDAIDRKLSIRGDIGTDRRQGEGYSIIVEEAQKEAGYVSIHSGGERFFSSPGVEKKLVYAHSPEFKFGTHLSIIFPG